MSFLRGPAVGGPATANSGREAADVEVSDPPADSISSLAFSSAGDFLAVGSWDNNVRIYEVNVRGQSQGKAMYQHQAPVLDVCWNKDGSKVISAGADNAARLYDLQTGQASQIAQHDDAIKSVRWFDSPQGSLVATGSWDKTLKYWDLRSPNPALSVALPERCYTMDVVYPFLVVGCASQHIRVYSLTNPTVAFREAMSPLKMQTRVVTCFPSANGYAVGSIEGRVGMQFMEESRKNDSYSFRCHRANQPPNNKENSLVYAVNDINFHPVHGTFSTVGSDGTYCFWDRDARVRMKTSEQAPGPIAASAFNRNGSIFAYAVSYDWSKGHQGMKPNHPNKIMLHACNDDEVKKRSSTSRR